MQMHFSPASPYARKCLVVAHEKGLATRIELIPTVPAELDAAFVAVNPLGKIPALLLDDGSQLYDSPVICEYLDSVTLEPVLLPTDGSRWQILRRAALADGTMDAALDVRMDSLRPDGERSASFAARRKAAIGRALDTLDSEVVALTGPIRLDQIAVGCILGYLDLRFAADRWRDGRPALESWYETFASRPSMMATMPA